MMDRGFQIVLEALYFIRLRQGEKEVKRYSWLLISMSLLIIFVVGCAPIPPPRLEVIIPPPTEAVGEEMEEVVVEPEETVAPEEVAEPEAEEEVTEAEMAVPVLTSPSANAELSEGELTLTGTGEPGTEVQVLVDGQATGVAQVGSDGSWSLEINLTEPGEYELSFQALDTSGAVVAEAEPISISVVVPVAEIVPPTLSLPGGGVGLETGPLTLTGTGEPGTEVQVLVDGQPVDVAEVGSDGSWSLEINLTEPGEYELNVQTLDASGSVVAEGEPASVSLAAPAPITAAAIAPEIIFPADEADIIVGELTLIGPGEPDTGVEVLDNSVVISTTEVGAEGEWTFTFDPAEGEHQFAVRPVGDEAATSGVVTVMVVSASESYDCNSNPGINRGDTYIVGTCDTLRGISEQLGVDFEALLEANPQVSGDIDLIYPGQILTIPQ
jgi:predicted  nucleic acid-binding Zn-ribbon protein